MDWEKSIFNQATLLKDSNIFLNCEFKPGKFIPDSFSNSNFKKLNTIAKVLY